MCYELSRPLRVCFALRNQLHVAEKRGGEMLFLKAIWHTGTRTLHVSCPSPNGGQCKSCGRAAGPLRLPGAEHTCVCCSCDRNSRRCGARPSCGTISVPCVARDSRCRRPRTAAEVLHPQCVQSQSNALSFRWLKGVVVKIDRRMCVDASHRLVCFSLAQNLVTRALDACGCSTFVALPSKPARRWLTNPAAASDVDETSCDGDPEADSFLGTQLSKSHLRVVQVECSTAHLVVFNLFALVRLCRSRPGGSGKPACEYESNRCMQCAPM